MSAYLRHPLVYVWSFLALATLVSWALASASEARSGPPSLWLTIFVLLIAVVKCRLVIRSYMEVKHAALWLKLACDAWLVLNFGMIGCFYWFAV